MFYVLPVSGMIEPDDATTEAHEFGGERSVVGYEDARSIQEFIALGNKLRAKFFESSRLPQVDIPSWMLVEEDAPTVTLSMYGEVGKGTTVGVPSTEQFGNYGPDGCWWLPVKRDGYSTWLVLEPVTGMPRVQLWTTDDEGRPVITPGPPSRHFIVRAEVCDNISMLWASAVERRCSGG
jgi:hypothetical protein